VRKLIKIKAGGAVIFKQTILVGTWNMTQFHMEEPTQMNY